MRSTLLLKYERGLEKHTHAGVQLRIGKVYSCWTWSMSRKWKGTRMLEYEVGLENVIDV